MAALSALRKESLAADRKRFDSHIAAFVKAHSGGDKQRTAPWYRAMGETVGGSELSAIMGTSKYGTFHDVVKSKVAIRMGRPLPFTGKAPCWWGTMFEDVIESYVEIDLGGRVQGSSICVRRFPGHRNSPDGYTVATVYVDERGLLRVWTSDKPIPPGAILCVVLLEFKCPFSRAPGRGVPPHYRPQVQSGLAVSPLAALGLFVDALFRKCKFADLGSSGKYDNEYHPRDRAQWVAPQAWGFIAVYAPRSSAPIGVRLGWAGETWAEGDPSGEGPDSDAALTAHQIASRCGRLPGGEADLGAAEGRVFERALSMIDGKRFLVRYTPPCFADGRGADLASPGALEAEVKKFSLSAPPHWSLMGVIPWKLFEVLYVPVTRQVGFIESVLPLVDKVHDLAARACSSPDPDDFLRTLLAEGRAPPSNTDELQDLFDACSGKNEIFQSPA